MARPMSRQRHSIYISTLRNDIQMYAKWFIYSTCCQATFHQVPVHTKDITWGVQVLSYPNFFSGMEADRNVKVVGGDVAVL